MSVSQFDLNWIKGLFVYLKFVTSPQLSALTNFSFRKEYFLIPLISRLLFERYFIFKYVVLYRTEGYRIYNTDINGKLYLKSYFSASKYKIFKKKYSLCQMYSSSEYNNLTNCILCQIYLTGEQKYSTNYILSLIRQVNTKTDELLFMPRKYKIFYKFTHLMSHLFNWWYRTLNNVNAASGFNVSVASTH